MKNACLLLILCLMLVNPIFGDTHNYIQSQSGLIVADIQERNVQVVTQDTTKNFSLKQTEGKRPRKEKSKDADEFEFITKLPAIKTFISGIESIVKGISKLIK